MVMRRYGDSTNFAARQASEWRNSGNTLCVPFEGGYQEYVCVKRGRRDGVAVGIQQPDRLGGLADGK